MVSSECPEAAGLVSHGNGLGSSGWGGGGSVQRGRFKCSSSEMTVACTPPTPDSWFNATLLGPLWHSCGAQSYLSLRNKNDLLETITTIACLPL